MAWIILGNTISGLQILAILMVTGFVALEMSYNSLIGKWQDEEDLIPDHIFKGGKQMKKSPSSEKRLRETRWDQR